MYAKWSSVAALGFLICTLCIGCSVKEDRRGCPCALVYDFSRVDPGRSDSLFLGILSGTDDFCHGRIVHSQDYSVPLRINVPRSGIWTNIYSDGAGTDTVSSMLSEDRSCLVIPAGEQCAAVYMFSAYVDTAPETVVVPVMLHKNYSILTIRMLYGGDKSLSLSLEGNVNGYGKDGRPAEGLFSFAPDLDGEGCCRARIPRQTDGSLRLTLSDGDGVLREFAVGEYILQSGYDWNADDLEDIDITIDYSKADVTFVVNDWEMTFDIDVEI